MHRIFVYLILLLNIVLHSCVTDVDTKDMNMKPKLVLHCYLVPQLDTTILRLSSSAPLFSGKPQKTDTVLNATVEISDDNTHWLNMEFNKAHGVYFITQKRFPIIEGKTYYIRATAPDYETVSSSCTVPFLRETQLNLYFEESGKDFHGGEVWEWDHYHGYLEWIDYWGEENYYMFAIKYPLVDDWINPTILYSYSWYLDRDANDKACIYSDHGMDGKKMSVLLMTYLPDEFETTMLQIDKNCYLFEKSIIDYDGDLQQFMLEPTQVYSNIKNGFGVFGAFVMQSYVFPLTD